MICRLCMGCFFIVWLRARVVCRVWVVFLEKLLGMIRLVILVLVLLGISNIVVCILCVICLVVILLFLFKCFLFMISRFVFLIFVQCSNFLQGLFFWILILMFSLGVLLKIFFIWALIVNFICLFIGDFGVNCF